MYPRECRPPVAPSSFGTSATTVHPSPTAIPSNAPAAGWRSSGSTPSLTSIATAEVEPQGCPRQRHKRSEEKLQLLDFLHSQPVPRNEQDHHHGQENHRTGQ